MDGNSLAGFRFEDHLRSFCKEIDRNGQRKMQLLLPPPIPCTMLYRSQTVGSTIHQVFEQTPPTATPVTNSCKPSPSPPLTMLEHRQLPHKRLPNSHTYTPPWDKIASVGTKKRVGASKRGKGPIICKWCSKEFSRASKLRIHERTHTGVRPFECTHCPKKFARPDHLRNHLRIHMGLKPFECETCGRCFGERSNLLRHKKKLHPCQPPPVAAHSSESESQTTDRTLTQ